MTSLVDRYENGEFAGVWDAVRLGQVDLHDATAVAAATMQRVAHNVDLIVGALAAAGWRWAYPDVRRARPSNKDLTAIGTLEKRIGPLPVALRACLTHVGEVWLCGTLPSWSVPTFAFDDIPGYANLADPLVLP